MEGGSTPKRAKVEVVDLSSLEEEDDEDDAAPATTTRSANGAVAHRHSNSDDEEEDDEDQEVQVMDPPPQPSFLATHSEEENDPNYEDDDDADDEEEIHLLGTKHAQHLPHMRPHCSKYPYVAEVIDVAGDEQQEPPSSSTTTSSSNASYCSRCYCYVCDVLVSECQEWGTHCHATDNSTYWVAQRRAKQARTTTATTTIFLRSTSPPLQATLRNARAFLTGLRVMCDMRLRSFTLICSEKGIQVEEIDDGAVSGTILSLPASGFTKYVCTPGGGSTNSNRLQLTLNRFDIANLKKYLKGARKTDDLVLQIKEAGGCLEVWREHATKDVPEHPIRLRVVHNDPGYTPLGVPTAFHPCTVAMDSARFKAMIEFLQNTGCENIKVTWRQGNPPTTTAAAGAGDDEPKVIFSSIAPWARDIRGANFYYFNGQQLGFTNQSTVVRCENSAVAIYSTRYLALFAKAAPMASRVLLSFSLDVPCAVEYRIPDWLDEGGGDADASSNAVSAGSLTFYLAPEEDEHDDGDY